MDRKLGRALVRERLAPRVLARRLVVLRIERFAQVALLGLGRSAHVNVGDDLNCIDDLGSEFLQRLLALDVGRALRLAHAVAVKAPMGGVLSLRPLLASIAAILLALRALAGRAAVARAAAPTRLTLLACLPARCVLTLGSVAARLVAALPAVAVAVAVAVTPTVPALLALAEPSLAVRLGSARMLVLRTRLSWRLRGRRRRR
jgi:hypothetical protein